MPEAFAVFAVLVVALAAWVGAWMHTRDPANLNVRDDEARLYQHAKWLEQRLELAEREKWGGEMVANISADIRITSEQLARARVRVGRR